MSPDTVDEYYVCPAVMIELVKENKFRINGGETVPKSYRDIKEARIKVKSFEWNSHLKKFDELYPYWPMNHALPELAMPDQLLDFTKPVKPALPTEENKDKFINAPSNIRYNGETWAANCRHHLSHWDEHPWCTWCYVATDIAECDEKTCYLCKVMTETQLKERKIARKKWKIRELKVNQRHLEQMGNL